MSVINCWTSFFGGFAIFTVLGFVSETLDKEVEDVISSGAYTAICQNNCMHVIAKAHIELVHRFWEENCVMHDMFWFSPEGFSNQTLLIFVSVQVNSPPPKQFNHLFHVEIKHCCSQDQDLRSWCTLKVSLKCQSHHCGLYCSLLCCSYSALTAR